jgi:fructuronate reductase
MVDRIVPATTDADRAEVEGALAMRDEGVVMTEPFSQWVIEDRFAGPRPAWMPWARRSWPTWRPMKPPSCGCSTCAFGAGLRAGRGPPVHQAVADPAPRDGRN